MKSNIRVIRIIQYLENHPSTSIREISDELGIGEDAVRYEIDNLNDYLEILSLEEVEKSHNGKLKSSISDTENLLNKILPIYKLSSDERREYLEFKLLYQCSINISHEMKILNVSRNTVKTDLKYIVERLKNYGISVVNWKIVTTSEESIRNYLFNFFKNHYLIVFESIDDITYVSEISKIIYNDFHKYDIIVITQFVRKITQESGNTTLFETFLLFTIIMIHRNILGFKYHQSEGTSDYDSEFLLLITEEVGVIEKEFKIDFNNLEVQKLVTIFTGFNSEYYNRFFEENIIRANVFVGNLVKHVEQALGYSFQGDQILLEGLFEHTKATMYRLKHDFVINSDTYYRAIEHHHELYVIVESGIRELELMMKVSLSKEEVALYVVHFLGAQRRYEDTQVMMKRAVLLCNSGYGTSVLLRNILEVNYELKVVDLISLYQLKLYDYTGIDIVISTIDLDYEIRTSLNIPVIYISPFLNFEDTKVLTKFGIGMKRSKNTLDLDKVMSIIEKSTVIINKTQLVDSLRSELSNRFVTAAQSESLFDELSVDDIYIIDTPIDWELALRIGGQHLVQRNIVSTKYVDEVFSSIDEYGPHFILGNRIAIPHARIDLGVFGSGMAVIVSKHDIIFSNELPVKLVFFIASTEKAKLLNTVMKTKELTENSHLYDEIQGMNKEQMLHYLQR